MSILNPRFDTPGTYPGEAESWTLRTHVAVAEFAAFTPEPLFAWEDFSRWYDFKFSLDECTVALAMFDPRKEGFEDFEEGWGNDYYLTEIPTGHVVIHPFDSEDFEMMGGAGWDVDSYAWTLDDVGTFIALFDGAEFEVFHRDPYAWDWSAVLGETAMFDGEPVEGFELDW
ncbi:MAG: hypothetical protein GY835_18295 [bacterium]|nr:hypothetical protein [bacterium]